VALGIDFCIFFTLVVMVG